MAPLRTVNGWITHLSMPKHIIRSVVEWHPSSHQKIKEAHKWMQKKRVSEASVAVQNTYIREQKKGQIDEPVLYTSILHNLIAQCIVSLKVLPTPSERSCNCLFHAKLSGHGSNYSPSHARKDLTELTWWVREEALQSIAWRSFGSERF